jgi:predicted AAA+ superfamily ATPase
LLRQSGESLAGRISYLELGPFDALEVAPSATETLWVRGGFPHSFLAKDDAVSLEWRRNFIRTYASAGAVLSHLQLLALVGASPFWLCFSVPLIA